jgi:hypothetical protein
MVNPNNVNVNVQYRLSFAQAVEGLRLCGDKDASNYQLRNLQVVIIGIVGLICAITLITNPEIYVAAYLLGLAVLAIAIVFCLKFMRDKKRLAKKTAPLLKEYDLTVTKEKIVINGQEETELWLDGTLLSAQELGICAIMTDEHLPLVIPETALEDKQAEEAFYVIKWGTKAPEQPKKRKFF